MEELLLHPLLASLLQPGMDAALHILGPYDEEWVEMLMGDFGAGVTVAATALPQVSCRLLYRVFVVF